MNAEKIIKKVKIAIVNKYYVSFDDVELLEYRTQYTFMHELTFYIKKLDMFLFVNACEAFEEIDNSEDFKDELHIYFYEYNGIEKLQEKQLELRDKVCEKCGCECEECNCDETCECGCNCEECNCEDDCNCQECDCENCSC